jgi:prophage maintenance system killer protein
VAETDASENRFARSFEELTDREHVLADRAVSAAQETFPAFKEEPESHYYQAPGLSPEETWHAITAEVGRVTTIAAIDAAQGAARGSGSLLAADDFEAMHSAIFRPIFGDSTLRIRQRDEQVTYGITLGPRDKPQQKKQDGISARSLPWRLRSIARDLERAAKLRDAAVAEGVSRRAITTTRAAAKAFSQLLANHPWMDGNGRTAFPLLNYALVRMGLLLVAVKETKDFHWCLGRAMRRSHRETEPLAVYLRDLIVASE